MGYSASGGGVIHFKEMPEQSVFDQLNNVLDLDYMDNLEANFSSYGKYYEDSVISALNAAAPYTESGEIEYSGEDGCRWRFIFQDGEWVEESGYTYYESEIPEKIKSKDVPEFLGQIVDVFEDLLSAYGVNKNPEKVVFNGKIYDAAVKELDFLMKKWKVYERI